MTNGDIYSAHFKSHNASKMPVEPMLKEAIAPNSEQTSCTDLFQSIPTTNKKWPSNLNGTLPISANQKHIDSSKLTEGRVFKEEVATDSNPYRVFFKNVSDADKATFQNSKCMFLVSVGQSYHEGAKLEASLKCMHKNFKEVVIIVGDVIQRYTHAVHQRKTAEELFDFAEMEGSQWLERNMPIIEKIFTKPYKVHRWGTYLEHPMFQHYNTRINIASQGDDVEYKLAFDECSEEFLQRANRGNLDLAPDSRGLCLRYLKEECTCICLWTEQESCDFLTYPYGLNSVWRVTCKRYIDQPGIMREVAFDIKRK